MTTENAPIYLSGQTGSGKTAVALALAKTLGPVEIINADAYQVYSGLEILTAAPTEEEKELVPHHLFGILDCDNECDAAAFSDLARAKIAEIEQRATPLVVGGSGLYLKAITHGLAPTPPGNPELRKKLEEHSLEQLVTQYRKLDPTGAKKTNLANRRYVTRNLEICILSGRPASEIKSVWQNNQPNIHAVYLRREREDIYARINRRTERMFEEGVVEEIAALGDLSTTAAKAIGIAEIQALIAGEMEREACVETIQKKTRHYAKRQATWFRREAAFRSVEVGADDEAETIAESVLSLP